MSDTQKVEPDTFSMEKMSSSSISNLATALAAAQANFKPIKRLGNNPTTNRRYADLQSIIEATRPALVQCGLCIFQTSKQEVNTDLTHGAVEVTTRLVHGDSGEFVVDKMSLPVVPGQRGDGPPAAQVTAQDFGETVTYCRKYSMQMLLGVAPEHDYDGGLVTADVLQAIQQQRDRAKGSTPPRSAAPKKKVWPTKNTVLHEQTVEWLAGAIEFGESKLAGNLNDKARSDVEAILENLREARMSKLTAGGQKTTP